jgi:hypothetical protein
MSTKSTPLQQSLLRRVFYQKGIMILAGIIGLALTILITLLLPIADAQSSDSSVGPNVTSPGVYPARIPILYFH